VSGLNGQGTRAQRVPELARERNFLAFRHLRDTLRFEACKIKLARVGEVLELDIAQ
jgi:hypothetical protein